MTWNQTYRGRKFHTLDPLPEEIHIDDIAHALSMQCRFNGHCREMYSVGQHSILVSRVVPERYAFAGLMHDAAEAYIGDMVRPLKNHLPEFRKIESRLMGAIHARFGIDMNEEMEREVKRGDNILLATEARDLMAPPPDEWNLAESPMRERIVVTIPRWTERQFLLRFAALCRHEDQDAAVDAFRATDEQ